MANLSVKEFSKEYKGLKLLTRSNETIQLGDLYGKKGLFKNRIEFHGYNVAYKLGLPVKEASDLKTRLDLQECINGAFAGKSIREEFASSAEVNLPGAGVEVSQHVDKSKILGFEIGDIKTKVLRDELRYEIERFIEKIQKNDAKEYRKELKGLFIVEQLFYSDQIKIFVNKEVDIAANASFGKKAGKVSVKRDSDKTHVFTFEGSNYPFAVDLRKINEFV